MSTATDPRDAADGPTAGRRRPGWPGVLRLLLGIGLLAVVVRTVDWNEFAATASRLVPAWALTAAVVTAIDRFWMAWKWRYLLEGLGVRVPLVEATRHYFLGSLVGLLLPWQMAGDVTRAFGLGLHVGEKRLVLASVVFEKLIGASASGLLSTVTLLLLTAHAGEGEWRTILPFVALLSLAAGLAPFLMTSALFRRPLGAASRILSGRPRRMLEDVLELTGRFAELRRVAVVFYVHTFLEQFVPLAAVLLVARALQLDVSPLHVLLVLPVIMFLTRLPVSVQAIGVQEGLYVLLFGLIGLRPAEAFALSLGYRVVDLAVHAVGSAAFAAVRRR